MRHPATLITMAIPANYYYYLLLYKSLPNLSDSKGPNLLFAEHIQDHFATQY